MSDICYTTDKTGLNDEEKKGYEFNTLYHPETTIDDEIRKINCSSYQDKINNQRSK